jgi:GH15 family glucan-1,4-alpha-glucosidase
MPFRPALLSNRSAAALIEGLEVVWFAAPRFDSPPIFAKVLDEERGGSWSLELGKIIERRYLDNAPILITRVRTSSGEAAVQDIIPLGLPALMRTIDAPEGAEYYFTFRPTVNYGVAEPYFKPTDRGGLYLDPLGKDAVELLILRGRCFGESPNRWYCEGPAKLMAIYLRSAELSIALNKDRAPVYSDLEAAADKTLEYWRSLLASRSPAAKPGDWLYERSAVVLLSLQHAISGGVVAAPTTSLPEVVGGPRNWDYRFVWVRDASIAASALASAGFVEEAARVVEFLTKVISPTGKPFDYTVYSVDGSPPVFEQELPWLKGFRGSSPVRAGNAATTQIQLDLEGWYMAALYDVYRAGAGRAFAERNWWAVELCADWCGKAYALPDYGIWEDRVGPRHYVHSKAMLWVCLDRAARLAEALGRREESGEWRGRAEEVKAYVLKNQPEAFTQAFDGGGPDGALLALPVYGFVDARDPRFERTLAEVERGLRRGPFVLRYEKDSIGPAVHPFLLASEWLGIVYALRGERGKAEEVLEAVRRCAGDIGLLGEHVDVETCEPRGNYPHAFSHAGYILLYDALRT